MPRSTTRPSSTTTIWSAARIVDSRCAMTIAVRPLSASASAACTAASEVESRCAVASSRIDDARLGQQQPGDGQPLALTAGEPVAALPDDGVQPVGQRLDQLAEPGRRQGAPQLVVGRLRCAERRFARDRVVEQVAVLGDDAERARGWPRSSGRARRRRRCAPHRSRRRRAGRAATRWSTCPPRTTRRGPASGRPRRGTRRRAAPRRRHGCRGRRPPPARPATPCRRSGRRSARGRTSTETPAVGHPTGVRRSGDHRLQVEHLEDPLEAHQRAHHLDPGAGQQRSAAVEPGQQHRQRDDVARVQRAVQGEVAAERRRPGPPPAPTPASAP